MTSSSPRLLETSAIQQHLAQWGLRRFLTEQDYYAWQREHLSPLDAGRLHHLSQRRQGGKDEAADREFYDIAASPDFLPVLYSQRYGFYEKVGLDIGARLSGAQRVLDFGCGVGILTTFFAKWFPGAAFVGLDRSAQSIAAAQRYAQALNLSNVSFIHADTHGAALSGRFDVIVATHALFQAETDPGLPSQSWETFVRPLNEQAQHEAESRTGLQDRLDFLISFLTPDGRCLLVEKARHLGRRILLQRALARRGFHLLEEPRFLTYNTVGEHTEDGPLYHISAQPAAIPFSWNEEPEQNPNEQLYICEGQAAQSVYLRLPDRVVTDRSTLSLDSEREICFERGTADQTLTYGIVFLSPDKTQLLIGGRQDEAAISDELRKLKNIADRPNAKQTGLLTLPHATPVQDQLDWLPLYENHTPSAQDVWTALPNRTVNLSHSAQESDGRQRHIELGVSGNCAYLYWSNTFDQRQLVIMEQARVHLLAQYYEESVNPTES